jgi:hypothetical protein
MAPPFFCAPAAAPSSGGPAPRPNRPAAPARAAPSARLRPSGTPSLPPTSSRRPPPADRPRSPAMRSSMLQSPRTGARRSRASSPAGTGLPDILPSPVLPRVSGTLRARAAFPVQINRARGHLSRKGGMCFNGSLRTAPTLFATSGKATAPRATGGATATAPFLRRPVPQPTSAPQGGQSPRPPLRVLPVLPVPTQAGNRTAANRPPSPPPIPGT